MQIISVNLKSLWNDDQMNTKDLSKIAVLKGMKLQKHCWEEDHNFSWDQKKVVDREIRLITRKIKETILEESWSHQQNFLHASWNMDS